jgi:hypothetical protein
MLQLNYTGAFKENDLQDNPSKSLGGYVSGSKVPSGNLNNLFSSISQFTKEKALFEIIGVVLKNTSQNNIVNIEIWTESESDSYCNVEIAVVSLASDGGGNFMEKITNRNSLPYNAVFYNIEGVANKINIGDLAIGGMLGIWFKRIIDKAKFVALNSDDTLYANYKAGIEVKIQENTNLKIQFS